ncbi:MAG: HIT family protein [Gemmataceae bacterium]|uniref:HIT family protein n=1 Tax=Thermogemmata fonticola TaxID=2755323 RepID=A0A7V9ACD1_9BACT|nr:HIT family protein [Thermogemmata fonticola]MBA2227013.1 HIT family protein [Thermogemmata fonticola]MCX8138804.1 HIT family protein [Gemmataceae bacterium]
MSEPSSCPLCAALADPQQHWGARQVWAFPHSVAVLGPWQYYTGYCLLVSREHVTELSQLGARRTPFLEEMALLAEAIEACFQPHKLNYELLGNQVPHLHWHLFPRYADDPQSRQPVWLALNRAENEPQERHRLEAGFLPPSESVARLQRWLREHGAPRGSERESEADGGAAEPQKRRGSGEPVP